MIKLILFLSFLIIFTSCSLFDSDEKYSHKVNLTVDDIHYYMEADDGFYKFIDYNNSEVLMNIWRAENESPQVWIYLPTNIVQGKIYSEKDIQSGFNVFYSSPNDEGYEISHDHSFILEITKWEGIDGKAKGSFSGVVKKSFSSVDDTLTIANGSFETTITSKITRP